MTDDMGERLKQEGINLVLDNEAGTDWAACIGPTFLKFANARVGQEITGEDFRRYATALCGKPHHHNAWGGVWSKFVRAKPSRLVDTGRTAVVMLAPGHKRRIPIWRILPA